MNLKKVHSQESTDVNRVSCILSIILNLITLKNACPSSLKFVKVKNFENFINKNRQQRQ
jgi:hypothetical protein